MSLDSPPAEVRHPDPGRSLGGDLGMGEGRRRRAAAGYGATLILMTLQLGSAGLIAPLILHFEGSRGLGAYSVLLQALSYVTVLDLGLGAAVGRFLAQSTTVARFRAVGSTVLAFYTVLNVIVAVVICVVAAMLGDIVSLEPAVLTEFRRALLVFAGWTVLKTPLTLYVPALAARQWLAEAAQAQMLGVAAKLVATVTALTLGFGLPGLIAAYCLGEAATYALARIRFGRRFPDLLFALRWREGALFREMLGFSMHQALTSIATRLVYSTDQLIVGTVNGLRAASVYYTTQMPAFLLTQAIWPLSDNAAPALNEFHAGGERDRFQAGVFRVARYTVLLAIGAAGGVALFNRPLVIAWVGREQYAGDLMTAALAGFVFCSIVNHTAAIALIVLGEVRVLSRAAVVLGVANVALSVLLAKLIGFQGVMVASALMEVVLFAILVTVTLRRITPPSAAEFVLPLARVAAVMVVCSGLILLAPDGGLAASAGYAAMFSAAWAVACWKLALAAAERDEFLGFLRARFGAGAA